MDFEKLTQRVSEAIDQRGGVESVKEDIEELKRIAQGDGTLAEKAKAALQAIQEPGDPTAHPHQPGGAAAGGATPHPDPNTEDKQDPAKLG